MLALQFGTSSSPTARRRSVRVSAATRASPATRAAAPRGPQAGPGGALDRGVAARHRPRDPLGARRRAGCARSSLTSAPVSIATGQAAAHELSAAQVSRPS